MHCPQLGGCGLHSPSRVLLLTTRALGHRAAIQFRLLRRRTDCRQREARKPATDARKTTRPKMKLSPTDATGTTQLCADRHVQDGQRPRTLQSPLWARGYNLRESARQLCIGDSTPSPTSAPPVTGATFTVDGSQVAPTRPYCSGGQAPSTTADTK